MKIFFIFLITSMMRTIAFAPSGLGGINSLFVRKEVHLSRFLLSSATYGRFGQASAIHSSSMSMKSTKADVDTKGGGKFNKLLSNMRKEKSKRDMENAAASPVYIEPKNSVSNDAVEATDKATGEGRPFTLPPGQFRPKQSLGQNFLSDQNYVMKIVDAFTDDSPEGRQVVEVGPGPGALTRVLFPRYPQMTAIELDQRAIAFLTDKLPGLNVIHQDVLQVDWPALANKKGGPIRVIANLPYYIVSQVLFSFADSHKAIEKAVVTMQLEVGERIVAKTNTKQYGIPSVVFQLYCDPKIVFKIPPSVFFPRPKVDSALVALDFTKPHPLLKSVDGNNLRKVITCAFQQRRKMLRSSLKDLIKKDKLHPLSEKWDSKRPEELKPEEFIALTKEMYGAATAVEDDGEYHNNYIWRKNIVEDTQKKKVRGGS